jgi:hypothetical protein
MIGAPSVEADYHNRYGKSNFSESFENWLHWRSTIFFDHASSRFAAKAKLALTRSDSCLCDRSAATSEPLSPKKPLNRAA